MEVGKPCLLEFRDTRKGCRRGYSRLGNINGVVFVPRTRRRKNSYTVAGRSKVFKLSIPPKRSEILRGYKNYPGGRFSDLEHLG
jgi:hypothetical protein